MFSEPITGVKRLAGVFRRLNVPYLVGGSLASSMYGIPRATQNVDVRADLKRRQSEEFAELLAEDFYVDVEMINDAIDRRASFNVIHLATMFKADVFIFEDSAWAREELRRARDEELTVSGTIATVRFASPEDTLLHKLRWYRMGNEVSERQWTDVLGIMNVQGNDLDFSYLRRWAEDLGVHALLEHAIEESR